MSRSLNKIQLIGNLGADPEIRTTNGGVKVATFSLATSRHWKTPSGETQEKTEWHRVVAFGTKGHSGLPEIIEKYCKKGDKIFVEGRVEYRSYQDKENQTRYVTEILAREILLLGGRNGESSEPRRAATPARATAGAGASRASDASSDFEEFPAGLEDDSDVPF
ncbi:MAG: single-stranded DNA-binding protein [Gemmatimonadaceae bacterium]|nr:single-stranded DNA-binding protein [Gemmatimonadaceae bacterium]